MNREQFLALLARLGGEGEPLTVDELRQVQAYVEANRGDAEAITDDELATVDETLRALADDEEATTEELLAAADVVDAIGTVVTERTEAAAAAEAEREAARQRLRPVAEGEGAGGEGEGGDGGEGQGDGEGAGAGGEGEGGEGGDGTGGEGGDGAGAGEGEGGEGQGTEGAQGEPVAATAAAQQSPRRPITPQTRRRAGGEHRPTAARRGARILRDGGGEFDDIYAMGEAMVDRRRAMLSFGQSGIGRDLIPVGRIEYDYPEDRVLDPDTPGLNMRRMEAVVSALRNVDAAGFDAVTAAGALCHPLQVLEGIPRLGENDRPMRGSFQQFNAGRGGIIFRNPLEGSSFADAVEIWTLEMNEAALTDPEVRKPCMRLECPGTSEAFIYAITECLTIDNFLARTDPDLVRATTEEVLVASARKAEVKLLDLTKEASKQVTAGTALGAWRDLVYHWTVAAVGIRSRRRLRQDAIVELRVPWWVLDMVRMDLMRSLPGDGTLNAANDLLNRALANSAIRIAGLYMDSPTTGASQVFEAQGTGQELLDFPADVQWHMTIPGSFLLLDNGGLNVGVWRDSELIKSNDYGTFSETMEGLAFTGLESTWGTSTVCPNGASSGTVDPSDFCTGQYVPSA